MKKEYLKPIVDVDITIAEDVLIASGGVHDLEDSTANEIWK